MVKNQDLEQTNHDPKIVNYVSNIGQHKTYTNSLIIFRLIYLMELQCGCAIDEIGGILLAECKGYKQANFRN